MIGLPEMNAMATGAPAPRRWLAGWAALAAMMVIGAYSVTILLAPRVCICLGCC